MWLIILLFSLAILHCIYLLCKISIKTKKEAAKRAIYDKNKILKYKCPSCGSDIEILKRTDYNMYFSCSNPYCFNHGWGSVDNSVMESHAQVKGIQESVPNPDNIKDWDLESAKDVEFTKVTESFNRKSDLD